MTTHNIDTHVKGNTFDALPFTISKATVPIDLTDASIKMQLRLFPNHPTYFELSTAGGQIEITDAAAGKFSIKEQIIDFPAGAYYYDIKITLADNTVKTYIGGRWTILQNITN